MKKEELLHELEGIWSSTYELGQKLRIEQDTRWILIEDLISEIDSLIAKVNESK